MKPQVVRVLGALGIHGSGPLLVQVGQELRVLRRGPWSLVTASVRVPASGPWDSELGPVWLGPYVPGADLEGMMDGLAAPCVVDGAALDAALDALARGLQVEVMSADRVRLSSDGALWYVEAPGGSTDAVADLRQALSEQIPPERVTSAEVSHDALCDRDHPLADRALELTPPRTAPAVPPKVISARIAGLTMIFGVAAGWMLGRTPMSWAEITLPAATTGVTLTCDLDERVVRVSASLGSSAATCQVEGMGLEPASVDTTTGGKYQCKVEDGAVACVRR